MRNRRFKIGAGLAVLVAALLSSASAQQPAVRAVSGHVPAIVSQLAAKGPVASTNQLTLSLGLPLRNREALTNLLQQIYDPGSPEYRHYLSTAEFAEQFGPTAQDYQKVIDFAQASGLTVIGTHPNRMLLDVAGNAATVERTFGVTLRVYHHPAENRDFFAPDAEPSVPSTLPVQDIGGLDNYRRPQPRHKTKSVIAPSVVAAAAKGKVAPNAANGSGPAGTYLGDDFRHAYAPGTTLNGSGQSIALVQFDGYLASDIALYESLAGRPNVPLQNVLLNGYSGAAGFNNVEVALDIEMVIAMAPGLSKVIVYEGNPNNFHPNDVLNRIANDNTARQISCSWGWIGGPTATTDQIFQQMALQGQTFFTASGDSDAYPPGTVDNPNGFGTPADSAYLTSVGGTTLTMQTPGVSYLGETVWNWGIRYGAVYDGIGSSGGISTYYAIPAWQTNVNMTAAQGSTTRRNFPDVALTADDVLVIADGGVAYDEGGTSCAAPLWAGFTALVNQLAAANSHAAVGFLNPALYAIGAGTNYLNCFHDTTTGNNRWTSSPNLFNAVTNYDLCTGLGTPNGTNLIFALASSATAITHLSPPPPPYGSTLANLNGGNPNGTWNLFELDDAVFDSGVITNGWILALTTANPVGAAADNALSMTASAGEVSVGGNGVYVLTVTNYGPSFATNVVVSDTLPLGAAFVSATPSLGSVTRAGSSLAWSVGITNALGQFVLATNTGAQLTVVVQPGSAGSFINSAFVTAATPDFNPDENSAQAALNAIVVGPPVLAGPVVATNGTFQFSIVSGPGQTNVIQSSTNLVNWVPIYTNVGSFTFTNAMDPNNPSRFYRDLILGP
jgi:uncharacterized repeat protein (TIGR01451 family)